MNPFKSLVLAAAMAAALATSAGAHAALVSVVGNGQQVPDADAAGIDIYLPVSDTRLIRASGNNVTLTLYNLEHEFVFQVAATLEQVGSTAGVQTVFDQILATGNHATWVGFDGNYVFNSGATDSLRNALDPINLTRDALPSGTYRPTLADDVTTSEMSSAWNGKSAAGVWRLNLSDHVGDYVSNANWGWRLDIEVEDAVAVPEPAMLPLLLLAAGSAGAWGRRRQRSGLAG